MILHNVEQEKCGTSMGLFKMPSENFKPQHNESILSLQYCNLTIEQNKNAEEWIGHLRIKVQECWYKEKSRRLKNNSLMV